MRYARVTARPYVHSSACLAMVLWCAVGLAQVQSPSDAYRSYSLQHKRAVDVGRSLDDTLEGKAQIVVDQRGNCVLVRGGDAAQRAAQQLIAQIDQPAQPLSRQPAMSNNAASERPRLLTIDWTVAETEQALSRLFGSRLRRAAPTRPGEVGFVVANSTGQSVVLRAEPSGGGLSFSGPEPLVSHVMRLVAAHDASRKTSVGAIRTVSLRQSDPQKVHQALDLYRHGNPPTRNSIAGSPQSQLAQAAPPPAGGAQEPANAAVKADAEQTNQRLRELGLDLSIEVLPDLDAIILHGSNRDVNEVLRIIEDIERLSAESVPEVEVVPLKHVSSEALAPMLGTIQRDLLAGRPGRVSITSLNKPNALLLIGRGETIKSVRELIAKLDQPVGPQTQLRVFRLRHAPAATAAMTAQQFFDKRPG